MNTRLPTFRALQRHLVRLSCTGKPHPPVCGRLVAPGHCAHQQLDFSRRVQPNRVHTKLPVRPADLGDNCRKRSMASSVTLQERDVRQVVSASLRSALAAPQHSWSEEFVVELLLGELTISSISGSGTDSHSDTNAASSTSTDCNSKDAGLDASISSRDAPSTKSSNRSNKHNRKNSSIAAAGVSSAAAAMEVSLAPDIAEALDVFMAAGDAAAASTSLTKPHNSSNRQRRSDSKEDDHQQQQQQYVLESLQARFSQILHDNYQQVEEEDVSALCQKLVTDLQQLVQAAAAEQADDLQGLCALCGRDMPLTKHHLIPRDVHKEFKKRGYGFDQLQSGLLVCRPCHSAIHRAVPDNKELAMHYRTLEDLQQHEAIAKFSAWASKQRVSSRVDASAKHFRYRK